MTNSKKLKVNPNHLKLFYWSTHDNQKNNPDFITLKIPIFIFNKLSIRLEIFIQSIYNAKVSKD